MAVLMREAIGGSLRRARTARRRTLRDVSRRARVSLGYLSEVERGRKEPSSELLAAICEALEIELHDLLTEAAGSLAAAAEAAGPRRPIGLRHMDLRLASAPDPLAPPLPTALPQPAVVQSAGSRPAVSRPGVAQPVGAGPDDARPAAQPAVVQPAVVQPGGPQPVAGESVPVQSVGPPAARPIAEVRVAA